MTSGFVRDARHGYVSDYTRRGHVHGVACMERALRQFATTAVAVGEALSRPRGDR